MVEGRTADDDLIKLADRIDVACNKVDRAILYRDRLLVEGWRYYPPRIGADPFWHVEAIDYMLTGIDLDDPESVREEMVRRIWERYPGKLAEQVAQDRDEQIAILAKVDYVMEGPIDDLDDGVTVARQLSTIGSRSRRLFKSRVEHGLYLDLPEYTKWTGYVMKPASEQFAQYDDTRELIDKWAKLLAVQHTEYDVREFFVLYRLIVPTPLSDDQKRACYDGLDRRYDLEAIEERRKDAKAANVLAQILKDYPWLDGIVN
jgi:hypothetical protein